MSQTTPRSPRTPVSRTSWVKHRAPWLYAFWKFSRPHTVIGTSLSAIGVYLIAVAERFSGNSSSIWTSLSPTAVLSALIACLCGNIYIVGLNQLEDVEIDRINKPHLPLASQEFSRRQGVTIVAIAGILSLLVSYLATPFLFGTLVTSLVIGTLYSLPPVRLKRFPFWASLCILTVRGGIVNLGLYLHYTMDQANAIRISPALWALTVFIVVFTSAIALFKDIPDTEGDRRYNIATLTLQMGRQAVFDLCRGLLTLAYVGMMGVGLAGLPGVNSTVLVVSHGLVLGLLWWGTTGVDLQDQRAVSRTYQFIWKLFFLEYLLFPLACFP